MPNHPLSSIAATATSRTVTRLHFGPPSTTPLYLPSICRLSDRRTENNGAARSNHRPPRDGGPTIEAKVRRRVGPDSHSSQHLRQHATMAVLNPSNNLVDFPAHRTWPVASQRHLHPAGSRAKASDGREVCHFCCELSLTASYDALFSVERVAIFSPEMPMPLTSAL